MMVLVLSETFQVIPALIKADIIKLVASTGPSHDASSSSKNTEINHDYTPATEIPCALRSSTSKAKPKQHVEPIAQMTTAGD